MNQKKSGWVDADKLIQQLHPDDILQHHGIPLPDHAKGNNYRIGCLIQDCDSGQSSYGKLSIELRAPYRIHCFSCGVKGNLFDLMWIAKHGRRPSGNRLRGKEFKEVCQSLQEITGVIRSELNDGLRQEAPADTPQEQKPVANRPLHKADNERTRALVNLWQDGITDPGQMSPAASRYWRRRDFLRELSEKWHVGWLPSDSKGTLRGRVIYPIESVAGEILAYAGRDPEYDAKLATWQRKKKRNEPIKTRFPSEKFFRRGLEFFGQQARRLEELGYKQKIWETGVLIVEGFNDVLALDQLQQPAIGAMSNRLTEEQVEKAVRFAKQTSGKITLMFDRNEAGVKGQQDVMARLGKHLPVFDGWSGYQGAATEPEELSETDWKQQQERIASAWRIARNEE